MVLVGCTPTTLQGTGHDVLHSHARLAAGHLEQAQQLRDSEQQGRQHQHQGRWGIHPFYVPDARPSPTTTGPLSTTSSSSKSVTGAPGDVFELAAPTAGRNAFRVLRALSLRKAVLLEGSPGVGKTALVAALAKRAGNKS
jgi:midasin